MFGGLPLIIDNLPFDCPSRNYYVRLFVEMAEAVRATQCRDGDWRTSLLDPDSYNMPENSCSAFMCYGIAWGSVMVIYSNVLINLYLKKGGNLW